MPKRFGPRGCYSIVTVVITYNVANIGIFIVLQVVQVTALDGDSGNNARVTYRVSSGDDRGSLDVHPSTGWVYVRGPLDRETQDTYELTVVASDNGSPSALAATVVVVITVADVNDNDPEFDREYYEFHVEENRPSGIVFGAVSATDRDVSDNALVRYSLIPTNSSFNINLYSGKCGDIYCT